MAFAHKDGKRAEAWPDYWERLRELIDFPYVQARHALQFTSHDPLTGHEVQSVTLRSGEKVMLSPGPGALIILGRELPEY